MRRGSKHSSYGQANYAGVPDDPTRARRLHNELWDAINAGHLYNSLTEDCRKKFSEATFNRLARNMECQRLQARLPKNAHVQEGSGKWVMTIHSLSAEEVKRLAHYLSRS